MLRTSHWLLVDIITSFVACNYWFYTMFETNNAEVNGFSNIVFGNVVKPQLLASLR